MERLKERKSERAGDGGATESGRVIKRKQARRRRPGAEAGVPPRVCSFRLGLGGLRLVTTERCRSSRSIAYHPCGR